MSEQRQGFCGYCQRLVLGEVHTISPAGFILGMIGFWFIARWMLGIFGIVAWALAFILGGLALVLKNSQARKSGATCPTCGTLLGPVPPVVYVQSPPTRTP